MVTRSVWTCCELQKSIFCSVVSLLSLSPPIQYHQPVRAQHSDPAGGSQASCLQSCSQAGCLQINNIRPGVEGMKLGSWSSSSRMTAPVARATDSLTAQTSTSLQLNIQLLFKTKCKTDLTLNSSVSVKGSLRKVLLTPELP